MLVRRLWNGVRIRLLRGEMARLQEGRETDRRHDILSVNGCWGLEILCDPLSILGPPRVCMGVGHVTHMILASVKCEEIAGNIDITF